MGCDDDVVKCLVFWANFFLALVGVSVLSLGITYKINLEELVYAIPKDYQNIVIVPIVTIPLGSVIIAIAVFGCYGCITERSTCLTIYGIILLAIFLIQLVTGISAFFQINDSSEFDRNLNDTLEIVFGNYDNYYEHKEVVDLIQHRDSLGIWRIWKKQDHFIPHAIFVILKCCGTNGSTYWSVIPRSCCETDTKIVYNEPCPPLVSRYLNYCMKVIGIVSLALSVTEISGSIISLTFAKYLKNSRRCQYVKPCPTYPFDSVLILDYSDTTS